MRTSIFLLLLLVLTSPSQAQTVRDTLLVMDDGVSLDAIYALPPVAAPRPVPAIVFVHGFNGSKADVRSNVLAYAGLGYATVGYSVRGQGASEGEFDFFTSPRLMDDLRSVMGTAAALPGVNPARVGVAGASQGGLHAWGAAARNLGARAVISIVSNGRYTENWTENEALNWLFANAILVSTVRMNPGLRDSLRTAINAGDVAWVRTALERFDSTPDELRVQTPVLMMSSYQDPFFHPTAALRQFAAIPAPKRLLLYPGGHEAPPEPGTRQVFMRLLDRWFEYWLKDWTTEQGVIAADSALAVTDGATQRIHWLGLADEAVWREGRSNERYRVDSVRLHATPDGRLTQAREGTSGSALLTYAPGLGSNALTYRSLAVPDDILLFGSKTRLTITAMGTGTRYQVAAWLTDVDPVSGVRLPIARAHREIPDNGTPSTRELTMDFTFHAHTLQAGHVLELRLTGGLGIFPGSADFGNAPMGPRMASATTLTIGDATSFVDLFSLAPASSTSASTTESPRDFSLSPAAPNPVPAGQGVVRFAMSGFGAEASTLSPDHLLVTDVMGRRVELPVTLSGTQLLLHTTSLPAGIYRVVIRRGTETRASSFCILR